MTAITENGFFDLSEDVYHADPAPFPSLSSTMCHDLLEGTEIEAKLNSRRLNPDYADESNDSMDIGTIAHDYVLRGGEGTYEIAPFDAWRSKDAKAARAAIEAKGLIALNEATAEKYLTSVKMMNQRLREQLADHREFAGLLEKGKAEQSGFAFDGDIWNRARFDWLDEAFPDLIVDYKTTALTFDRWEKSELWESKYLQNPHYRHTYDTITGRKSRFVYLVQRTKAPYLMKIFYIDQSYMDHVENRYNAARHKFMHCLKTGVWRGEPPYSVHAYPPPWTFQKWEYDEMEAKAMKSVEQKSADNPDLLMAG